MNPSKKHTLYCISLVIAPVVFLIGINIVVDPFQIYHRSFFDLGFSTSQRYQNAGKINSYLDESFDSIIIGDSTMDNFLPTDVQSMLGWYRTLKLTIDGGSPSEIGTTLQRALSKGNIKHVLWGINERLISKKKIVWNPRYEFPSYLYTDSILDDGQYLLNWDILKLSLSLVTKTDSFSKDINHLNYWMNESIQQLVNFNEGKNLLSLQQRIEDHRKSDMEGNKIGVFKAPNESVDYNIIRLIEENPNVQFELFFTPYPLQRYYFVENLFDEAMEFHAMMADRCRKLNNVRLTFLRNERSIVANMANYIDNSHFHSGINILILERVKTGEDVLDYRNIEERNAMFERFVLNGNVFSDFDTMTPLRTREENEYLQSVLPIEPRSTTI